MGCATSKADAADEYEYVMRVSIMESDMGTHGSRVRRQAQLAVLEARKVRGTFVLCMHAELSVHAEEEQG